MAFISESEVHLSDLKMTTRCIEEGDQGTVLLFLHGNPDNADEWKPVMERLRASYRCLAPDLPGYGRRGKTYELPASFDYSVASQVKYLNAFLQAKGITERLTLVVHDIGGMMGIAWAAENLGRLNGIVYTNTVAFAGFDWFPIARRWGTPGLVASLSMRALAPFGGHLFGTGEAVLFKKIFAQDAPQLDQEQVERFAYNFALNPIAKRTALRQFRRMIQADSFQDYDAKLRSIAEAVPAWVIWGDRDPYVPSHYRNAFAVPEERVKLLSGVGHWVPIVAPEEIAKAVRQLNEAPTPK
jgi:pimeloyl-ACP methyl ester carboxylesterase